MAKNRSKIKDKIRRRHGRLSRTEAGKGDAPRPVDREKWNNAPYWKERDKRIAKEKKNDKG